MPIGTTKRAISAPGLAVLAALVLGGQFSPGVEAEVSKWLDEQGGVHYGDAPPPGLEVQTMPTPPPPSNEAMLQSRSRLEQMRIQAAQRRKELENRRQVAAREERARRERCRKARYELRSAQLVGRAFYLDEEGNRVYLTEAERAARIERAQSEVRTNCP